MLPVQAYAMSLLFLNCFVPQGNLNRTVKKHQTNTLRIAALATGTVESPSCYRRTEGKPALGNQITSSFHCLVQAPASPLQASTTGTQQAVYLQFSSRYENQIFLTLMLI